MREYLKLYGDLQRREVLTELGMWRSVVVCWEFVWEKRREILRGGGGRPSLYFTMGG